MQICKGLFYLIRDSRESLKDAEVKVIYFKLKLNKSSQYLFATLK